MNNAHKIERIHTLAVPAKERERSDEEWWHNEVEISVKQFLWVSIPLWVDCKIQLMKIIDKIQLRRTTKPITFGVRVGQNEYDQANITNDKYVSELW